MCNKGNEFKLNTYEFTPENLAREIPLKILAADDSQVNQILIRKFLSKIGYDVTIANDGLEAFEIASKIKFDLILLDIQMPKMDGFEVSLKIREQSFGQSIPYIVAMTGDDSSESKNKFSEFGINEYLTKPINISEIYKMIRKVFLK